ncbi:MAG: hypothetical protein GXY05_04500 [Clostridiales bacterium]|nr:hypothetical protein [Clostridiales bacterium]
MTEKSENYGLSEQDVVFVLTALQALKEDLAGFLADEAKRDAAQLNIVFIDSATKKLENHEIEFSSDECRVMYIAALEMRDLMNKILDDKKSPEYDREMARSTLYSSNAMMRSLRKTMIANGFDVDSFS